MRPLRSLPATVVENAAWREGPVAERNGRIARMIAKAAGGDPLVAADSAQFSYPDLGGLSRAVHPDCNWREAVTVRR